jgi:hypothetical protein
LNHGSTAESLDVERLGRIIRRIQGDPGRSEKDKEIMVTHLRQVMTMLLAAPKAKAARKKSTRVA